MLYSSIDVLIIRPSLFIVENNHAHDNMVDEKAIQAAQEKFGALLRKQLERVEVLKTSPTGPTTPNWTN